MSFRHMLKQAFMLQPYLIVYDEKLVRKVFYLERWKMIVEKSQFRSAGKGFVLAAIGDGLPSMRRLVEAYKGRDNKIYIKLNGELTRLLPSHLFIPGN